jgi:hypothetical protein
MVYYETKTLTNGENVTNIDKHAEFELNGVLYVVSHINVESSTFRAAFSSAASISVFSKTSGVVTCFWKHCHSPSHS